MNSIAKIILLTVIALLSSACVHHPYHAIYSPAYAVPNGGYTVIHRNYYRTPPSHFNHGHFPHRHYEFNVHNHLNVHDHNHGHGHNHNRIAPGGSGRRHQNAGPQPHRFNGSRHH